MTQSKLPDISIVVPIYNSEAFLRQCVDSLINQTFKNIEIILVNDGSPDNSLTICQEYVQKDGRVVLIDQKNAGQAAAWTNATIVAKGEYIVYLDADDWLNIRACEDSFELAKIHNADIVFWPFIKEFSDRSVKETPIFDDDKVFQGEDIVWLRRRIVGLVDEEITEPTRTDAINSTWGKLYRRSLIIDNEIPFVSTNVIGSTDVLFNIQLFQHVNKAVYLRKFYTHYRKYNPHSLTRNYKFTLLQKYTSLFSHIDQYIDNTGLDNMYKKALNNRISLSVINILLSVINSSNSAPIKDKMFYIKEVLQHPFYERALSSFDSSFLPIYWRIFFMLCRKKTVSGVYFLGTIMQKMR